MKSDNFCTYIKCCCPPSHGWTLLWVGGWVQKRTQQRIPPPHSTVMRFVLGSEVSLTIGMLGWRRGVMRTEKWGEPTKWNGRIGPVVITSFYTALRSFFTTPHKEKLILVPAVYDYSKHNGSMQGLLALHFWSFQRHRSAAFGAYGDGNHFHDNWATPSSEKGNEDRLRARLLALCEFKSRGNSSAIKNVR